MEVHRHTLSLSRGSHGDTLRAPPPTALTTEVRTTGHVSVFVDVRGKNKRDARCVEDQENGNGDFVFF